MEPLGQFRLEGALFAAAREIARMLVPVGTRFRGEGGAQGFEIDFGKAR